MRPLVFAVLVVAAWVLSAQAHDIPNAQVDRSIQATVRPGRLLISYEIVLSELTLTQDLRALIGTLPGADRREWFDEYGRIGGPLNAKGLLVSVDGRPLVLRSGGFDLSVEDHVRYTFHFEADLPPRGRLAVRDTNYASGEGTSRLAVQGMNGIVIRGDDLPSDVTKIPNRRVWQLTDAEERRTRQLEIQFEPGGGMIGTAPAPPARSRHEARLDPYGRPRGSRNSWTAPRFRDWVYGSSRSRWGQLTRSSRVMASRSWPRRQSAGEGIGNAVSPSPS